MDSKVDVREDTIDDGTLVELEDTVLDVVEVDTVLLDGVIIDDAKGKDCEDAEDNNKIDEMADPLDSVDKSDV